MRVYIDEDVARDIALALVADHDVLYVPDTDARRNTDAWHLKEASIEQRVLITVNHTDFRFLHRVWTSMRLFAPIYTQHSGILTVTRTPTPPELWTEPLRERLSSREAFAGRLLLWHAERDEWREDAWRPDD